MCAGVVPMFVVAAAALLALAASQESLEGDAPPGRHCAAGHEPCAEEFMSPGDVLGLLQKSLEEPQESGLSEIGANVTSSDRGLLGRRVGTPRTDLYGKNVGTSTKLNGATMQSPDGRVFYGFRQREFGYFRFEGMTVDAEYGTPVLEDSQFSFYIPTISGKNCFPDCANMCFPNQHKPFSMVNGNAVYEFFMLGGGHRLKMKLIVQDPFTANAKIIGHEMGEMDDMNEELGWGQISMDGRLFVGHGSGGFNALKSNAEPCAATGWSKVRSYGEMHDDPDGLGLRDRYGLAAYKITNYEGQQLDLEKAKYPWLDYEARNLWFASGHVIGADTHGRLHWPDSPYQKYDGEFFWSPQWSFECERTKATRVPGEAHTSGIGVCDDSVAARVMPISHGHSVFPVFWIGGYVEVNLGDAWKGNQFDMLNLGMTMDTYSDFETKAYDDSPNAFTGMLLGDAAFGGWISKTLQSPLQGESNLARPLVLNGNGALRVVLNETTNVTGGDYKVKGIASSIRAFTAQVSVQLIEPAEGCNTVFHHSSLKLRVDADPPPAVKNLGEKCDASSPKLCPTPGYCEWCGAGACCSYNKREQDMVEYPECSEFTGFTNGVRRQCVIPTSLQAKRRATWTLAGVDINGGEWGQGGKWHHLALVFDGVDQTIITYLNGKEVTRKGVDFKTLRLSEGELLIGSKTAPWSAIQEAEAFPDWNWNNEDYEGILKDSYENLGTGACSLSRNGEAGWYKQVKSSNITLDGCTSTCSMSRKCRYITYMPGICLLYDGRAEGCEIRRDSSRGWDEANSYKRSLLQHQWGDSCAFKGSIDMIRLMSHARSQMTICGESLGSDCMGDVDYNPTSTQFELKMQHPGCSADALGSLACASAYHKVCANLGAKKARQAGVEHSVLGSIHPPSPPVPMGGVPVAVSQLGAVSVACTPTDHFSVPVEWRWLATYDQRCRVVTYHRDRYLGCNLAAHKFCGAALPTSNKRTGMLFEADHRAWVTCFAAKEVLSLSAADVPECANTSIDACDLAVSAACASSGADAGIIQEMETGKLTVHCFDAPANMGVVKFNNSAPKTSCQKSAFRDTLCPP